MDLIEKTLNYRGESTPVFFRELSAGEQVKLAAGVRSTVRDGTSEVTLDFALEGERGHRMIQMTLVTEDGKPVYSSLAKLQEEKTSKIARLLALAREAAAEFAKDGEDEGND